MDPNSTTPIIVGIIAASPGLFASIVLVWRWYHGEGRKTNADALETMQDTLDKAIDLNQKLQIRIEGVEQRTVILLADNQKKGRQLDEIERVNKIVIAENRRLEKYVKLLIEEIRRCGGNVPPLPELIIEEDPKTTVDRED